MAEEQMGRKAMLDRARRRAAQAIELRIAGYTYAAIADSVGYAHASAAQKAVVRALAAEEEAQKGDRQRLRDMHNLRIERLIRAAWTPALKGDVKAVTAIRGLLERQAKLNGLDAPINVKITDGIDEEIEALLSQMGLTELEGAT